jgi:hypothetical protein
VIVAFACLVGVVAIVVGWRRTYGPMRMGDFFKVEIPRTLDKPLAIGTRMDIAAALEKGGATREELATLCDGAHDRELLDRYWAMKDQAG